MEELLRFIVSSILGKDDVVIVFDEKSDEYVFTLRLDPGDMGVIIGKKGSVVKSIRQLLRVRQPDPRKHVVLKLEPLA